MLSYEKSKEITEKLKAAGFPNIGTAWKDPNSEMTATYEVEGWEEIYFPVSLSELIEACGDDFDSLVNLNDGLWGAYKKIENKKVCCGSSPEEAVANLWIALHKD